MLNFSENPRVESAKKAISQLPAIDVYTFSRAGRIVNDHVTLSPELTLAVTWEPTVVPGVRPWFVCPVCSARRRFLHQHPDGRIECRVCADLVYDSRRQRWKSAAAQRRALKLRRKIGAEPQLYGALPKYPRRIVREIQLCERELLGAIAHTHAMHMRKARS